MAAIQRVKIHGETLKLTDFFAIVLAVFIALWLYTIVLGVVIYMTLAILIRVGEERLKDYSDSLNAPISMDLMGADYRHVFSFPS